MQDWEAASPGKASKTVRMEFKRIAAVNADPQAVVRAEVHALNQGDAARSLAFRPDAQVFSTPEIPIV